MWSSKSKQPKNGLIMTIFKSLALSYKHTTLYSSFVYSNNTSGKHVRAMNTPKTGVCRGIPIFHIFAPKHRLWVLVRTASVQHFFW